MQQRSIAGCSVPVIGQGTWEMEGDDDPVAALRRGLDLGLTHIDTAEMYGAGRVEEIVGEAIRGRRDEVFLASKVMPQNASRRGTVAACEASLRRLGCEYLDLYLLHWPGAQPLEETFAAFAELRAQGKIRAFGVSNFDVDDLDRAHRFAGDALACNQVLYHLQRRDMEQRVLPWCAAHAVPVVAYSPFGQGDFPAAGVGGGVLEEITAHHGASRYQIALGFLLRHDNVLAIPKASAVPHVEDNAAAGEVALGAAEIARIDEAFPMPPAGELPML